MKILILATIFGIVYFNIYKSHNSSLSIYYEKTKYYGTLLHLIKMGYGLKKILILLSELFQQVNQVEKILRM